MITCFDWLRTTCVRTSAETAAKKPIMARRPFTNSGTGPLKAIISAYVDRNISMQDGRVVCNWAGSVHKLQESQREHLSICIDAVVITCAISQTTTR